MWYLGVFLTFVVLLPTALFFYLGLGSVFIACDDEVSSEYRSAAACRAVFLFIITSVGCYCAVRVATAYGVS